MCTRKQIVARSFARARRLHELGVAVDQEHFERMRAESAGLSILQNYALPSIIQDLPSGDTACCFNVIVANDSVCDVLEARAVHFDGPGWLYGLHLIPDPRRVKGSEYPDQYFLHPNQCGYDRECVLNHRVGQKHRLFPGEYLEGLLLAVANYSMPFDCSDRERINVLVKLIDQHGRTTSCRFGLMIERSAERKQLMKTISRPRTRRSLFAPEGSAEKCESQVATDGYYESVTVETAT